MGVPPLGIDTLGPSLDSEGVTLSPGTDNVDPSIGVDSVVPPPEGAAGV